jgi:hypothetical protein
MPKCTNIESWLDSWEELLELMAAAEMLELRGTRAQQDFLDSVQWTDDSWATSQRISMIAKQELGGSFMCYGVCSEPKDHVFLSDMR